jgi:hypothetical protein
LDETAKPDRWSIAARWIAGLVVGIIIGVAISAYLVGRMNRARADWMKLIRAGSPAAEAWLEDIRAGRLGKAHDAMTPEARARMDRAAFEAYIAEYPAVKATPVVRTYSTLGGRSGLRIGLDGIGFDDVPPRFEMKGSFTPSDGVTTVDFEIVILRDRTSDRLLVDQFNIAPAPPPKP